MKHFVSFVLLTLLSLGNACAATSSSSITWLTNYEEAVNQAKASNKPLLLFFTGTGWCGACAKLEREALNTPEFAAAAGTEFIFVKLDFPKNAGVSQDSKTRTQNQQLLNKFSIRSFPTVVLLDSQLQKIGVAEPRLGGGKIYADQLLKMVKDYTSYLQGIQKVGSQKLTGGDLKPLLEKAKELFLEIDQQKILAAGIQSDQKPFFQLEKYRLLAQQGLVHDAEAATLKKQLLASDPANANHTFYDVAVIEFEAFLEEMAKENYAPEIAIAPLVEYLEKFGSKDKENQWKLQMIISQVFLDQNRLAQALHYAQSSYAIAPPSVQPQIATAIRKLQTQSQPH